MRGRKKAAFAASSIGVVALAVLAWAGVSAAVSGGGYQPDQQDCPANADAWNASASSTNPGCHNVAVNVESGGTTDGNASPDNTRFVEWGNNQAPNDPNSQGTPTLLSVGYPGQNGSPHAGCLATNTDGTNGGTGTGCGSNSAGTGFEANYDYYLLLCPITAMAGSAICEDPSYGTTPQAPASVTTATGQSQVLTDVLNKGLIVYFGMDDNTDNGEHDGVSGIPAGGYCVDPNTGDQYPCDSNASANGPSDGGGIMLSFEPQWLQAAQAPTATHPEGLANYSEGECADGICSEATTQQQTVYHGCRSDSETQCTTASGKSQPVYYNAAPSSVTENANCSSGDAKGESCGGSGLDVYSSQTPQYMNADPGVQTYQDPDPQRSPAAPIGTPGTYVGTCGVYANDSSTTAGQGVVSFFTGGNLSDPPGGWVVGPTDPSC